MTTNEPSISLKTYTVGTQLLDIPDRGHVRWSQSTNNSGTCTPAYNAYAPSEGGLIGWFKDCDCGKAPIGCAAVAMGQIMWYWQWPNSSSYRTYNWNLMPDMLTNGMTAEGDEIAHLLKDCATAANTTFMCAGSFTTMSNIEDALRNKFNFKAARMAAKKHWYNDAWGDLIRSEIDSERPVIYRGDKCDLCTEKHIFVIDGYDATDPDLFRFNFGWGYPGNWYNTGAFLNLGDITPGSHEYNENQSVIIGISPTYYAPSNTNITGVSYTTVTGNKTEEAQQTIVLPASGRNLSVENGGDLTLVAGNSITLRSGFHAKQGSQFSARVDNTYSMSGEMEISVPGWPTAMSPERGGFWIWVNNANSFDIEVIDRYNRVIYQGAGTISGNRVDLWDGTGAGSGDAVYVYRIRLKNNFGRIIDETRDITLIHTRMQSTSLEDSVGVDNEHYVFSDNIIENTLPTDDDVFIYPNPNTGIVNINIKGYNYSNYHIKVYNAAGILIYQDTKITEPIHSFNMSNLTNGVYMIQLEIGNKVISKKLILLK